MIRLIILLFAVSSVIGVCAQAPAEVERILLKHLSDVSTYGTYAGSYDDGKSKAANDPAEFVDFVHLFSSCQSARGAPTVRVRTFRAPLKKTTY